MIVYDTDSEEQSIVLGSRVDDEDMLDRDLLQTFAPDELPEARNRGFRRYG